MKNFTEYTTNTTNKRVRGEESGDEQDDWTDSSEKILAGFREGNLSFTCHILI